MTTLAYTIGEAGTLGFPADQPDGTPMPLDGLTMRLAIYQAGADIFIPGYASSGPFLFPDGTTRDHPSIIAFDFPADLDLDARAYRCAVQILVDATWSTLEGHNHIIDARRP